MASGEQARKRAEIIIKVQSEQMTATEAARQLGISRKAYYKWEQRGLKALIGAVSDRSPGRPSTPEDPVKETMAKSLAEMERHLLLAEQRAEIRDYFITNTEKKELDQAWETIRKKKQGEKKNRDPDD